MAHEVVRSQMGQIIRSLHTQQKRRQQLQLMREYYGSTDADMASINYVNKETSNQESVQLLCTDSTLRTFESIQIQD